MTPVQHATFFIDESGAKASAGNFFVVAGIKTRQPGRLQRRIEQLRDETGFTDEFKFSRINRDRLPVFLRLADVVAEHDVRLVASIVNRSDSSNPFKCGDDTWRVHARIVSQLIVGNMSRDEQAAALIDHVSTAPNVSFGDTVKGMANQRMKSNSLVSAVTIDSRANDLLQVADLVAGAIGNHRKSPNPPTVNHKTRVANNLAQAFAVQRFDDVRAGRLNIMTMTRMGERR
ncbi:DUF3800 domain-containing protein [Gordonia sp. (in: high G+C Gram-positive bacteria)]|uniref:DUF3800 domain-containing protein n=1 Tax=Gordonia sp. (in: high G+C Gram-positive bacteria) TaxID=84139 RepID=UPI003F9AE2C7